MFMLHTYKIIIIVFFFFICEIALRKIDRGYGNSPLEKSQFYHHEHPKNYSFLMHDPNNEYGGHIIYYDEERYRVKNSKESNFLTEDSDQSIIFIGDSYTEGLQVSFEKTFAHIVGKKLKFSILNLGVSSYSPILYDIQIKNKIADSKAPLIIMQIYSNDFIDDQNYMKYAKYNNNIVEGIEGGKKNIFLILARKSYVLRFIRKYQLLLFQSVVSREEKIKLVNQVLSFKKTIKQEDLLPTSKIIADINKLLLIKRKKLYVFMIPNLKFSHDQKCCEKDVLYEGFMNEMHSEGINTLDVASYFNNVPNQEDLFYELDIHLTEYGHEVMANAILSELKKVSLVK